MFLDHKDTLFISFRSLNKSKSHHNIIDCSAITVQTATIILKSFISPFRTELVLSLQNSVAMQKYLIFLFVLLSGYAGAQITSEKYKQPVSFTTQQDHQNMMDQLGIKSLRPGPSGNESAPNHANYDTATANPYPVLPDVLILKNGRKVTTPEQWWKQRRPEIVEDMEREVYGLLPGNPTTGVLFVPGHGVQHEGWTTLKPILQWIRSM
jgi:hypothetical protein